MCYKSSQKQGKSTDFIQILNNTQIIHNTEILKNKNKNFLFIKMKNNMSKRVSYRKFSNFSDFDPDRFYTAIDLLTSAVQSVERGKCEFSLCIWDYLRILRISRSRYEISREGVRSPKSKRYDITCREHLRSF